MPVMTKTPRGDQIVILSREEYDRLTDDREDQIDAAALRAAVARREAGREELLSSTEVDAYLAAKTPLAFWRKKRGLTQAALAAKTGIAQGFLSEIEAGKKTGDLNTLRKLADALDLMLDDIVV